MFTETLNSTSTSENIMEADKSNEEPNDDDDDENDNSSDTIIEEFPPLPTDVDILSYGDASDPYDNRQNTLDLFYCPSPPLPPPPPAPPSSSATTMTRKHKNCNTFTSIGTRDSTNQPIISFSTQQKKKARAPIVSFLENIYVNMPKPVPPPPLPPPSSSSSSSSVSKSISISNEVIYTTLINATSLVTSDHSDGITHHAEYQQIQHKSKKLDENRIYENIPVRRPPPPPCCSPKIIPQRPISWSIIPIEDNQSAALFNSTKKNIISNSLEHIYINLSFQNDQPPIIPKRTIKTVRIASPPILCSPTPPAIPPRQDLKEEVGCLSPIVPTSSIETEQDVFETSSNASTIQSVKDLPINITSNSDSQHSKTPLTTETSNPPSCLSTRQRRALQNARRRRLRGSIALRSHLRGSTAASTTRQQNSRSNNNVTVRHPMTTDERWRRTLHKRRRQRVLQMKLDGNVINQPKKSVRPTSEHAYNEIKQPNVSNNNRIHTNGQHGQIGGVLERAMQFNGALRDRVFSWYKGANQTARELVREQTSGQIILISENGESEQKDSTANEEEEEEEEDDDDDEDVEEEEEEFFTHDTFEDFLLRRRPKSSNSTTGSGSSTVISQPEPNLQRLPVRSSPPNKKSQIPPSSRPPAPPAPPRHLPPTPPPARRLPGLALGLDKTDVDFIHSMLQRTRDDHRVWNRITALKEAYIRATSKKKDSPKKPKPTSDPNDKNKKKKELIMKHSFAATKIRAELEKYDELPTSSPTILDDEDEYDETCSVNIHHQKNFRPPHHHCSVPTLPRVPSTTHRLLNFVTSIKKRAQNNVQQLQKNLHDIRSRVHVESMTLSAKHMNMPSQISASSRQKQIFKDVTNTQASIRRTNSHHSGTSKEYSKTIHQHRFTRTQSNASQIPEQQRHNIRQHHRQTNDKLSITTHRSPSLTVRPHPANERRSIRHLKDDHTPNQQRMKKTT